jgi:hypothetical protein
MGQGQPVHKDPAIEALKRRLVAMELKFGGQSHGTKRHVSPLDLREESMTCRIKGGDRMGTKHKYASVYAAHLIGFVGKPITLVEVGVFRGVGLAIWCDLFPSGYIVGLDIDLSHYGEAVPGLIRRGAFTKNRPRLRTYDQLAPCCLEDALKGRKIDVYIDDGLHTDEAILSSLLHAKQYFSVDAGIFLEDTTTVGPKVREVMPEWNIEIYENIVHASREA